MRRGTTATPAWPERPPSARLKATIPKVTTARPGLPASPPPSPRRGSTPRVTTEPPELPKAGALAGRKPARRPPTPSRARARAGREAGQGENWRTTGASRVRAGRNAAREAPEGLKSGEIRRRRAAADRTEGKVESMSLNFGLTYVRVWVKLSVDRSITVGPLAVTTTVVVTTAVGTTVVRGLLKDSQESKEAIHVTCSRYRPRNH